MMAIAQQVIASFWWMHWLLLMIGFTCSGAVLTLVITIFVRPECLVVLFWHLCAFPPMYMDYASSRIWHALWDPLPAECQLRRL